MLVSLQVVIQVSANFHVEISTSHNAILMKCLRHCPASLLLAYSVPMLRLSEKYLLIWSLYLAGAMDIATKAVIRWLIRTLRSLNRSMGVQQAMVLAGMWKKSWDSTTNMFRETFMQMHRCSEEIQYGKRYTDQGSSKLLHNLLNTAFQSERFSRQCPVQSNHCILRLFFFGKVLLDSARW